jgi:hypothetical protein
LHDLELDIVVMGMKEQDRMVCAELPCRHGTAAGSNVSQHGTPAVAGIGQSRGGVQRGQTRVMDVFGVRGDGWRECNKV